MRVDFIRSGSSQIRRLRSLSTPPPPPLTRQEVEDALGEPVARCELWWTKWVSRIYRVESARSGTVIAKQLCTLGEAEVQQEYEQLQALGRLAVPALYVPRPVALLAGRRSYLVELARGRSLEALFWDAGDGPDLAAACALAGQVLARLHAAWTVAVSPVPADALGHDLAALPGGLSARAREVVRRALDRLAACRVAVGQPYLDFNPRNVFYDEGTIGLIDPPGESRQGLLLWDCATFSADLRRELWKAALLRPWRRRRALVNRSLAAFAEAYQSTYAEARPGVPVVPLLSRVLELQRVGQLMAQRVEQLRLVVRHGQNPLPRSSHRLRGALLAVASLGLLEIQKRWLVRRLAQELENGTDGGAAGPP
jgi:Ser/Thr protein kinase RdoA (MazF antagonist)